MIDKQKRTQQTRAAERLRTEKVVCERRRHNHQFVDITRWPDAHTGVRRVLSLITILRRSRRSLRRILRV